MKQNSVEFSLMHMEVTVLIFKHDTENNKGLKPMYKIKTTLNYHHVSCVLSWSRDDHWGCLSMFEMQCSKNEEHYFTSPFHVSYNTYGMSGFSM